MKCYDETLTKDVFSTSYSTTYQTDYKKYNDVTRITYDYQRGRDEKSEKPSRLYEREDHETFAKLRKDAHIPFELHLYPKPILHTDPHKPFEELRELPKGLKEEAIKTRPRVFMVPAIPMDDIKDPEMRELLCYHTYTTEWGKMEKEATANFKKIKPKIDKIETTDKVSLKLNLMPPLSEKFRKMGKNWDDDQARGDPDPTKEFWIHKEKVIPVICGACVDPLKNIVATDTKKVISRLINEEKLRYPHDLKVCTTYDGFAPMLPMGIPLEKRHMPTVHPLLSVSQALSNRTVEEMEELKRIADSMYFLFFFICICTVYSVHVM